MNGSDPLSRLRAIWHDVVLEHDLTAQLAAVLVYGSNAESVLRSTALLSSEIDLRVVTHRPLALQQCPLDPPVLDHLSRQQVVPLKNTLVVYNGVLPRIPRDNELFLDIGGDDMPRILAKDAASVIVAHKPRIPVYGSDVYERLESEPITLPMRRQMLATMTHYITREFIPRSDLYATSAISKNAIFLASLLDEATIPLNDKSAIVARISARFPDMQHHLTRFLRGLLDPGSVDPDSIRSLFVEFTAHYDRHCS